MVQLTQQQIDVLHYAYSGCLSDPNAFVASYLQQELGAAGESLSRCLGRLGTSAISVASNLDRCVNTELNAAAPGRSAPEAPAEISLPPSTPHPSSIPAFTEENPGYEHCRYLESTASNYFEAASTPNAGATYNTQVSQVEVDTPPNFRNLTHFLEALRASYVDRLNHPPARATLVQPPPIPLPQSRHILAWGFHSNFLGLLARPEITRGEIPTPWLRSTNLLNLEAGWIHEWTGHTSFGVGALAMLGIDGNGVSALGALVFQVGSGEERRYQIRLVGGYDFGLSMPRVGALFAITKQGSLSTCALQGVLFPWAMANPTRMSQCLRHSRDYPSVSDSSASFVAGALWSVDPQAPSYPSPYLGFSFRPWVKAGWILDFGFTIINAVLPRL